MEIVIAVISVIAGIVGSIVTAIIIEKIRRNKPNEDIKVVNELEDVLRYDLSAKRVVKRSKEEEDAAFGTLMLPPISIPDEIQYKLLPVALVVGVLLSLLTYWLLSGDFPLF